jgi:diguanylate cyclase (GGDEF)-like protein
MNQRRPVVIEDVRADIRLAVAAYWSTSVTTVAMVPIRSHDPLGALACYWTARHWPSAQGLSALHALADSAALAVDNATLRATLEDQVGRRTAELEELNRRLHREIAERKRAEEEVRRLSLVDELTGLYNRRGFNLLAGRELKSVQRTGRRALVFYIDIDGLKQANDSHGHEAGDRLLARAAAVLRSVTREVDVAARVGGDEFAVFMTLGYDPPPVHLIVQRFLDAAKTHDLKWSIGATTTPPERQVTLDDLLFAADQAMYGGRRARRATRPVSVGFQTN